MQLLQLETGLWKEICQHLGLVEIVNLSQSCKQFWTGLYEIKDAKRQWLRQLPRAVAKMLVVQLREHFQFISREPLSKFSFFEHYLYKGLMQWCDENEMMKPTDGHVYVEIGYNRNIVRCEFPICAQEKGQRRYLKYDEMYIEARVETELCGTIECARHYIDGGMDRRYKYQPMKYTNGLFAEVKKLGLIESIECLQLSKNRQTEDSERFHRSLQDEDIF